MNLKVSFEEGMEKVFEGEGGSYISWSCSKFPMLGEAKVGAGKLILHPCGFAFPHYSDCSKICYVIQGCCTVGMLFPNSTKEKVLKVKKGNAIPVPRGVSSWWFNGEDSDDVEIIFIGETSKAHVAGQFSYFLLTGKLGVLGTFSADLICRSFNMNEEETNKIFKSQTGSLIIKLKEGLKIPTPSETDPDLIFNFERQLPHHRSEKENQIESFTSTMTSVDLPMLKAFGLSVKLAKLGHSSGTAPYYVADGEVQVIYIVRGSGRIQIVGFEGTRVLDESVEAGDIIIVPSMFVVTEVAEKGGMECFSLFTSARPTFVLLGGKSSVWKAFSPNVVQNSLGVSPDLSDLSLSKV